MKAHATLAVCRRRRCCLFLSLHRLHKQQDPLDKQRLHSRVHFNILQLDIEEWNAAQGLSLPYRQLESDPVLESWCADSLPGQRLGIDPALL
jgi:hypothetical protein